jgi:hypothetical protein
MPNPFIVIPLELYEVVPPAVGVIIPLARNPLLAVILPAVFKELGVPVMPKNLFMKFFVVDKEPVETKPLTPSIAIC